MPQPRTLPDVECLNCKIMFRPKAADDRYHSRECYFMHRFGPDISSTGTKKCTRCGEVKSLEDFHRASAARGGRQTRCKKCAIEVAKADYAENREQRKARVTQWRAENKPKVHTYQHRAALKSKFGITLEAYTERLVSQGNKCAICGATEPGRGKRVFSVDHDHRCCPGKITCGKCIRGLLCCSCNDGLGRFMDNPNFLIAAAAYLRLTSSPP